MCAKRKFSQWILILMTVVMASCDKNVFDEEKYIEIIEIAQPVDSIDDNHTWNLTKTYNITAEVGTEYAVARRLMILSGNPIAGENATLLGDYPVNGSGAINLSFVAPSMASSFYAALVDEHGNCVITPIQQDQQRVTFQPSTVTSGEIDSKLVGLQSYSYCYEDEMPQPGDYDYNDVVLRISMERTAQKQITLNVTLAAVGSKAQIAAAMAIVGYKYNDIESVTTVDDETFDDGYRKSTLPFIDSNRLLIKGIDSTAVINMFEDAHWATGVASYASEGYLERYMYNVSKTTSDEYDMMSPRTISYVVNFKDATSLNNFTLDQIDPFIIIEYMGAFMEVHANYKYRLQTILYEYKQPISATILPWALIIPSSSFRYPLNGTNIGFAKNGALFGAYMTEGHSFGEWAANHSSATDWYNYPTGNLVY